METQHAEATPTLVMRRFFKALNDGNLMALELWAAHDAFDGGDTNYAKKLDMWVVSQHDAGTLSLEVLEWLLTYTKGRNHSFFRRPYEQNGRRRGGRTDNWRGVVCDIVRKWMMHPANMTVVQKRIARLTHEIDWLAPTYELLDSDAGRDWLSMISSPARIMEMALTRRTSWKEGKSVPGPICMPMIERLLAKGPVDLTLCGDELLREYKSDENRPLALRLIAHRDTSFPMPAQFTQFIKETIDGYKWYQRMKQDLPTLLKAKTNEPD